jgi:hypothetical protein
MKKGDLVMHSTGDMGIVQRIDYQHYGARQAFKHVGRPRGHCVNSNEADVIAPTRDGIQNRVLVLFSSKGEMEYTYVPSNSLKVISESR